MSPVSKWCDAYRWDFIMNLSVGVILGYWVSLLINQNRINFINILHLNYRQNILQQEMCLLFFYDVISRLPISNLRNFSLGDLAAENLSFFSLLAFIYFYFASSRTFRRTCLLILHRYHGYKEITLKLIMT